MRWMGRARPPDQSIEENGDGSLTVRFRAGGIDEMCRHLFTWGESVSVERPVCRQWRLAGMYESLAAHHRESWLPPKSQGTIRVMASNSGRAALDDKRDAMRHTGPELSSRGAGSEAFRAGSLS